MKKIKTPNKSSDKNVIFGIFGLGFGSIVALLVCGILSDNSSSLTPAPTNIFFIFAIIFTILLVSLFPVMQSINKDKHDLNIRKMFYMTLGGFLGFYFAITGIVLNSYQNTGNDLLNTFILYPTIKNDLYSASTDPLKWTDEQKKWLDNKSPTQLKIKDEKLSYWCAIQDAKLSIWEKELTDSSQVSESTIIKGILWQGLRTRFYHQGCLTEDEWLASHNEMAMHLKDNGGLLQSTWEPLAFIHPLVDALTSAHHLTWPRLLMSPSKYCHFRKYTLKDGYKVDEMKLHESCSTILLKINPNHNEHGPIKWRWNMTGYLKDQNSNISPMTEEQRMQIINHMEENKNLWQVKIDKEDIK